MRSKYIVIDKKMLPDVFEKVIKAKDLIKSGRVKGITEAVKTVDISRSTFYKYKDFVFALSEGNLGKKVTISLLLDHHTGVLSIILNRIADRRGNVLTINQNIPINNVANVTVTFDISEFEDNFDEFLKSIEQIEGVNLLTLVAMG